LSTLALRETAETALPELTKATGVPGLATVTDPIGKLNFDPPVKLAHKCLLRLHHPRFRHRQKGESDPHVDTSAFQSLDLD